MFFSFVTFSQAPDWSVAPNSFQYSMTFTVFLNANGTTLTNSNDKIGAFVNNQKRGEAFVTFNQNANKYLAYLTVYSNVVGETIHFKMYDSQKNEIIDGLQTQTFAINGDVGGVFQSFSIANPALSKQATILSFNFKNSTVISTNISANEITILVPNSTLVTNLIPQFTLESNGKAFINNQLQISGVGALDFTNSVTYTVLSEDESILKNYKVIVTKTTVTEPLISTISVDNEFVSTKIIPVQITFSNDITSLATTNFSVTNGIVKSATKKTNKSYDLEIVAFNQGEVEIKLLENKVVDINNNWNVASNNLIISYDVVKPIIKEIYPSQDNFIIRFSEDVKNVDKSLFGLKGIINQAFQIIDLTKISENEYVLQLNTNQNGVGNVYPYIIGNSITDKAGNQLASQTFEEFFKASQLKIEDTDFDRFIELYPNPVHDLMHIKYDKSEITNVVLFDVNNKKLMQAKVDSNNFSLYFNDYSSGLYILKMTNKNNSVIVKKIIKK